MLLVYLNGKSRGVDMASETAMMCIRLGLARSEDITDTKRIVHVDLDKALGMRVKYKIKHGKIDLDTLQPDPDNQGDTRNYLFP